MSKIKDQNKLIAEFMGLSIKEGVCYYTDADDMFPMGIEVEEPYLPYHTSWDWLMPVVEKIEHKIEPEVRVLIYEDEVEIWQKTEPKWTELVNVQANGDGKLSNTYKAVVEFIKQYNK